MECRHRIAGQTRGTQCLRSDMRATLQQLKQSILFRLKKGPGQDRIRPLSSFHNGQATKQQSERHPRRRRKRQICDPRRLRRGNHLPSPVYYLRTKSNYSHSTTSKAPSPPSAPPKPNTPPPCSSSSPGASPTHHTSHTSAPPWRAPRTYP